MTGDVQADTLRTGPTDLTPPRHGSARLAVVLLWVTLAWNLVEGAISISAGVAAASIALVGFGLDSLIEVSAAGILLWRMSLPRHDERAESRERIAHRVVGATFIILALYIFAQTIYAFAMRNEPDSSTVGLVLAAVATVAMPVIGLAKRANATKIGSRALVAESTETIICSYLSATLFLGLAANAFFGWWWADLAAALLMVPWIAKEGREGLRGESCEEDAGA